MVVEIHLSPGNEHDAAHGRRSMAALGAFMGAHLLMDRAYEGDSTRLPAESFGLAPVVPAQEEPYCLMGLRQGGAQGAEHGRTRLQPHEAPPQGRHPPDRPDETFLADLRLILIATYLKKHSQNPTSVNTP